MTARVVALALLGALSCAEDVNYLDVIFVHKLYGCGVTVAAVISLTGKDDDPAALGNSMANHGGYSLTAALHKRHNGDAEHVLCVSINFGYQL